MTTEIQECGPAAPMADARCGSAAWAGDNRPEGDSPHLAPALRAAARARTLSARIRTETSGLRVNKQRRRMPVADRRATGASTSSEVQAGPPMRPPPPGQDEYRGSAGFVPTAATREVLEEHGRTGPWYLNSPRLEEPDPIWRRMLAWTFHRPGISQRARPVFRAERGRGFGQRARGFGAIDTTAFDQLQRQRPSAPAGPPNSETGPYRNVDEGMSVPQSRALVPVAAELPTESAPHVWMPHLRYLAARLGMAEARTGFRPRMRGRLLRRLTAWAKKDAVAARHSRITIHASFDAWSEPAGGTGVLGWLVPRSEPVPACCTPRSGRSRSAPGAGARATLSHPLALGAAVVFGAVIGVVLSLFYEYLPERLSYPWLTSAPSSGISAGPAALVRPQASRQQAAGLVQSVEPGGNGRTEVQAARTALAISGPLALATQFGNAGEHVSADRSEITTSVVGADSHPNRWQMLYRLGHEFRRRGDLDAAVQTFALATKLNPSHAAILYDWGYGLQQKGEDLAAIDKYEKVVELDPAHPHVHYNLGYLLQQQGDEEAAIRNYRAAARTSFDNPFLYYNWGLILKGRHDSRSAVEQ